MTERMELLSDPARSAFVHGMLVLTRIGVQPPVRAPEKNAFHRDSLDSQVPQN